MAEGCRCEWGRVAGDDGGWFRHPKGRVGGAPERGTRASHTRERRTTGGRRRCVGGKHRQTTPRNNQHNPQYANYWAPLTRKRHIPPHPAQPGHSNDWAPRTRKRHQQEHRLQRPTERSDPTQHAEGRAGDCPGPRKGATTQRNVTQGVPERGSNARMDRNDNSAAEEQFRQWPPSHPPAGPNRTAFCFGPKVNKPLPFVLSRAI